MNLFTIFVYVISSVILFYILNYFDKAEKENNIIHAVVPIIYEIVLAGIFTNFGIDGVNSNIFLIVIFELFIRLYYVKNILKREDLMNPSFYLQIYTISILGCYFVNRYFISEVISVFPSAEEMKVGIWLLIILFLYFLAKKHIHFQYKEQVSTFGERKQEYIVVQYTRFKNMYHKDIKLKEKELNLILYAIMIYENYKRPKFFRKIDTIFYRFTGSERKLGIMQIPSRVELDDVASIKLASRKIEKISSSIKSTKKNLVIDILNQYYENENVVREVNEIYQQIIKFNEL